MSLSPPRLRDRLDALALAVPPLLYLLIAPIIAWRHRAAINPDGIIYIRKAQFLLEGNFWQSVSGYWPPAISWCVALILKISPHTVPLHAIRLVLVVWGFTWVSGACLLIRCLAPGSAKWRLVGGCAIALEGVLQAVGLITPDLLLGTMLVIYLALITGRRLFDRPWVALLGGLAAGLGYLCKAYALPFFCLHFTFTVLYRHVQARRGRQWGGGGGDGADLTAANPGRAMITFACGMAGFAVLALPWVAVLSHKYGQFTISMVYHHNHMNVGDVWAQETLPDFCVVPPDPYICIWEGLDPGPRRDWSPFASWRNFQTQLGIAQDHASAIIGNVATFDSVGLVVLAGLLALVPFRWLTRVEWFSAVPPWIVLSGVIYCLGFLVVAFEVRYIVPILLPLGLALGLREWEDFRDRRGTTPWPVWFERAPAIFAVLFLFSALLKFYPVALDAPIRPIYSNVAAFLKARHLDARFTSSDNNSGVNVAYYLNHKVILIPFGLDFDKIERELDATDVQEVLVWWDVRLDTSTSYPRTLATMLRLSGRWRLALVHKIDSVRRLDVYVRQRAPIAHQPATDQGNEDD